MNTYGLPALVPASVLSDEYTVSGSELLAKVDEFEIYEVMLFSDPFIVSEVLVWNVETQTYLYDNTGSQTLFRHKMELPISVWVKMMDTWNDDGCNVSMQPITRSHPKSCPCLHCTGYLGGGYGCENCDHSRTSGDLDYNKFVCRVPVDGATYLIGYAVNESDVRYWCDCVYGEVTEEVVREFMLSGVSVDGSYVPGSRISRVKRAC